MPKSINEVFSDKQLLLKLLEIILCLIGIILLQYVYVFYDRWVYEMLVIGLGGYLLICTVAFISNIQDDGAISTVTDCMFMITGGVLNLIAGIMTLVQHGKNDSFSGVGVTYALSTNSKNIDLGLGIVGILVAIVMLVDFTLGVLS